MQMCWAASPHPLDSRFGIGKVFFCIRQCTGIIFGSLLYVKSFTRFAGRNTHVAPSRRADGESAGPLLLKSPFRISQNTSCAANCVPWTLHNSLRANRGAAESHPWMVLLNDTCCLCDFAGECRNASQAFPDHFTLSGI